MPTAPKLTESQRLFLHAIGDAVDATPWRLASWMQDIDGRFFTVQGVSSIAGALIRKGLVQRIRYPGTTTYCLTSAGRVARRQLLLEEQSR
jgi:hypothetical protein